MAREPLVTVVTPTIPGREAALEEARASVLAQTLVPPPIHLVAIDRARRGPARVRNQLIREATTEWIAFLDDDDLLDPDHLDALLETASATGADVVSSWFRWPEGDGPFDPPRVAAFDGNLLRHENFIPVTAIARRSRLLDAGGFNPHDRYEDWALWLRMLDAGSRFAVLPRVTWTYRPTVQSRTTRAPHTWKQRLRYLRRRLT